MPLRGSQVILSSRGGGRVLDLYPTRRRFLVSGRASLLVLRSVPDFSSKVYPHGLALFTAQLAMG